MSSNLRIPDERHAPAYDPGVAYRAWPYPEMVATSLKDSARGIDPGDIDRIFDAFFTTKPNGIGIRIFHVVLLIAEGVADR